MRVYEQCQWLTSGSSNNCNKNCIKQFCKIHLCAIRKGYTPPRPCRSCGVGTNSESLLCRPCGNTTAQMRLLRKGRKARELFPMVMIELLARFQ